MRNDNVGDYPWLLFSLATLMEEYVRLREEEGERGAAWRTRVLEGLIDGLTPDPWAFLGAPPEALRPYGKEHSRLREALAEHREDLAEELVRLRPGREAYSPLSLHCNFPHNAIMAKVSIHLADENAPNLPMDAMFTRADGLRPAEPDAEPGVSQAAGREAREESGARAGSGPVAKDDAAGATTEDLVSANHPEALARYLMAYSGASPERLGRRGARLIIYDPNVGLRYYKMALQAMRAGS